MACLDDAGSSKRNHNELCKCPNCECGTNCMCGKDKTKQCKPCSIFAEYFEVAPSRENISEQNKPKNIHPLSKCCSSRVNVEQQFLSSKSPLPSQEYVFLQSCQVEIMKRRQNSQVVA